jgi:hypothetical protein
LGFLDEVESLGSAKLPILCVCALLVLNERGLAERVNHFLGAALLRKEVNEDEEGEGAGGKEMFETEGSMDGST